MIEMLVNLENCVEEYPETYRKWILEELSVMEEELFVFLIQLIM